MSEVDFSQPQRQHILGVVIYLFKNFRVVLSLIVAFLAIGSVKPWVMIILSLLMLLLMAFILVLTYLQYHNFTYQLIDDSIVIKSGVISKNQQIIPYERIQSVLISANLLQQVLGLVGLKIDTAGARNEELEIPALKAGVARSLQGLLRQKSELRPEVASQPESFLSTEERASTFPERETEEILVKLNIGDLAKVGLTENHLRNGFLAVAVIFSYFSQYYEYFESQIQEKVQEYSGDILHWGYTLVLMGVGIFLVASVVLSMVRTILRYYQFEAHLLQGFIFLKSGLLKRNEFRIPVSKVQFLRWHSNPLRRLFRLKTVEIFQAQSAEENGRSKLSIPGCYPRQSAKLKQHVFEDLVIQPDFELRPLPAAYVGLMAAILFLPLGAAVYGCMLLQIGWWWPVLFYVAALLIVWKRALNIRIKVSRDMVVLNKGWLLSGQTFLPLFKSQSVRFSQPVFLRRRDLAHLTFYTASGGITVRYLKSADAWQLYNHAMAQTILNTRKWM